MKILFLYYINNTNTISFFGILTYIIASLNLINFHTFSIPYITIYKRGKILRMTVIFYLIPLIRVKLFNILKFIHTKKNNYCNISF